MVSDSQTMLRREQISTLLMSVRASLRVFSSSLLDRKAENYLLYYISRSRSSSFDCLRKNLGLCVKQVSSCQTWWHRGQGEMKHQMNPLSWLVILGWIWAEEVFSLNLHIKLFLLPHGTLWTVRCRSLCLCGERFPTRDGFLELFVSVNSGKVKLRVQLRAVAFSPHALAGTREMYLELEQGICGLCP
jgi:hypothetical protein